MTGGGNIDGDIQLESGRYRIVPMEGGAHAVVELKPGAYPNEGDIPLPPLANGAQRKSDRSLRDAPRCDAPPAKQLGPIRVLVLYTPAAKAQTSNIRAEIKLAIKQLNDALSKTGGNVSIKAELAEARPVSYVEADETEIDGRQVAGMEIDLDRLSGNEPGSPRCAINTKPTWCISWWATRRPILAASAGCRRSIRSVPTPRTGPIR